MKIRITRRALMSCLGLAGLGALLDPAGVMADEKDASQSAMASFAGDWTYRSFLSNPDIKIDFNQLEFARADLRIDRSPFGVLQGKLSFDDDNLTLKGNIAYGNPFTARFQGKGATPGTEGWIYDYLGFLVPAWPNGVDQRPLIVGTVIRTVPHSNGKAKAGVVASFIAVKRDS